MPNEKKIIALAFKTLRKKLLLTQSEFGALLGITKQTVLHIEHARWIPQAKTQRKFRALQQKHASKKRSDEGAVQW